MFHQLFNRKTLHLLTQGLVRPLPAWLETSSPLPPLLTSPLTSPSTPLRWESYIHFRSKHCQIVPLKSSISTITPSKSNTTFLIWHSYIICFQAQSWWQATSNSSVSVLKFWKCNFGRKKCHSTVYLHYMKLILKTYNWSNYFLLLLNC